MTWHQVYDPLGSWLLSTAVAAVPVLVLFAALVLFRLRVWLAALAGLAVALALATLVFGMPAPLAAVAASSGALFGLTRIAWIVLASLFLYEVARETGQFEIMKRSVAAVSRDQRVQLLVVAFCFGAFLEGMGGGGAPVAIAGSFLIGLGFPPARAAALCLIANTAPVGWGAVGTPLRVLAGVSGLPEAALSMMTGRILAPLSAILPLWLVRSFVPWRRTFEVLPVIAVAGLSFAATQLYWSSRGDTGLVDVVSGLVSLLAVVTFLRFWQPSSFVGPPVPRAERLPPLLVLRGWSPFLLATVSIFLSGLPRVQTLLSFPELRVPVPLLHRAVVRVPPVVPLPEAEPALLDLNLLALPAAAIMAAAVVAALLAGMPPARLVRLFLRTLVRFFPSLAAIGFMVSLAFVTRSSGMDTALGLALTRTGALYTFFGTLLGWLGVALTGTDAGSNALFGNLQRLTAEQLGLPPVLMAAANSAGGVMGKMVDAQSIVVASAATQQTGREADLFKVLWKHSLALAALVGLIVTAYAFLLPAAVPAP